MRLASEFAVASMSFYTVSSMRPVMNGSSEPPKNSKNQIRALIAGKLLRKGICAADPRQLSEIATAS